jgi:uncharacterized protein YqhQ
MSVVVYRGGGRVRGRGRGRALNDNNIGLDTNEMDDLDLIDQVRQQNKVFKLPETTRLELIKQLTPQKNVYHEDDNGDRFIALEKKIDKIAESFSVFSVFAQWSGNLTVITSKFSVVVFLFSKFISILDIRFEQWIGVVILGIYLFFFIDFARILKIFE